MINHLRQIAIFATTIDHGSFRAAAKALKLSPSVISSQISELEAQLGVALIYRSTRSLALTKDGKDLLRSARIMMEAAENGIQSITAKASEPSGELRITLPAVLAHSEMIGQLSTFSM
jgi:DNA-binding transcriptional LysR family regulator